MINFIAQYLLRLLLKIWHLSVYGNKIQLFFASLIHSNSLLGWAGANPQPVSSRQQAVHAGAAD